MSRAFEVLNAFDTILTGAGLTGSPLVLKTRAYEIESVPAIALSISGQNSTSENLAFVDEEVSIDMRIFHEGKADQLDNLLLSLHAEAYAAIMTSNRLGLNFVLDLDPASMSEPQIDGDGKKAVIAANFTWVVRYRHNRNSMTS